MVTHKSFTLFWSNIIWMDLVMRTHQLMHIDGFKQFTMKKYIFNIELMKGPRFWKSYDKSCTNSRWFHDWDEYFIIMQSNLLRPTITYKSSFVSLKWTVWFHFVMEYPHTNTINIWRLRYQFPHVIFNKSNFIMTTYSQWRLLGQQPWTSPTFSYAHPNGLVHH